MGKEKDVFLSIDKSQIQICYLFMAADGEISSKELNYFNEIGKCYSNFKEEKKDIIDYCERIIKEGYEPLKAIKKIVKNESITLKEQPVGFIGSLLNLGSYFSCRANKENASLLWLLINLGYADGDYSDSEREIVSYIAKECEIPNDILLEFEDIAKTIEVLENYKLELNNQTLPFSYVKKLLFFKIKKTHKGKSQEEINQEIERIEDDKQKLTESIFALINEWE